MKKTIKKSTIKKGMLILITLVVGIAILTGCGETTDSGSDTDIIGDELNNNNNNQTVQTIEVGSVSNISVSEDGAGITWNDGKNATDYEVRIGDTVITTKENEITVPTHLAPLASGTTIKVLAFNGNYKSEIVTYTYIKENVIPDEPGPSGYTRQELQEYQELENSIKEKINNKYNLGMENIDIRMYNSEDKSASVYIAKDGETVKIDFIIEDDNVRLITNYDTTAPSLLSTIMEREDFSGTLQQKLEDGWTIKETLFDGTTGVRDKSYSDGFRYSVNNKVVLVIEKNGEIEIVETLFDVNQNDFDYSSKLGHEYERSKNSVIPSFMDGSFETEINEEQCTVYDSETSVYQNYMKEKALESNTQ